ncbi:MAG: hypothetical protein R6U27_12560, partial [Desulfobacterales bacterium]
VDFDEFDERATPIADAADSADTADTSDAGDTAPPDSADSAIELCIAETGHRRIRHPSRKESEALDETKHDGFRVDNPLLNQYNPVVSNVFLEVYVRAGNHQVVGPILSLVVDAKAMILQIHPTASNHLITCNREFGQPESSKNLVKAVAVVRREGMLVVGKVLGNLVHLSCLIHRTADEEDPFSHSRLSPLLFTGFLR